MKTFLLLALAIVLLAIVVPALAQNRNALVVRTFVDQRCDGVYDSADDPLPDVTTALVFPDGSYMERLTRSHGMAFFSGFDASGRLALVTLFDTSVAPCVPGAEVQELRFERSFKFVQIGVQRVATGTSGVRLP